MKWRKLGHVFCPDGSSNWMHSHAMLPIAEQIDGDLHRIYFSPRDTKNRGHGAYLELDMRNPTKVVRVHADPILVPGDLGCFDDSGALPASFVTVGDRKLAYYCGVNVGVTVPFRTSIGLAEWNEERQRFERSFPGPIIDRTRDYPHFVTAPEVKYENGHFRMWFSRCVRWEDTPNGPKHYYNLEYAESQDGINWNRTGATAIDFDEHEYAIVVPRVIQNKNGYEMWFCSRATAKQPTYQLRHAASADGITWIRSADAGIEISSSGWDSEMICYPYVFSHRDQQYLLYNGNGYGRTGFGIAVME